MLQAEAAKATQAINRQGEIAQATARNEALAEDLASGAYQKHARAMEDLNRQHTKLQRDAHRDLDREDWMKRGTYTDELTTTNHEMEKLRRGIDDGSYKSLAKLREEMTRLKREAELTSRYGSRLGGFMARNEALVAGAGVATAAAAFTIHGRAQRGFAGTVEEYRSQAADRELDREIASVFKPLKDAGTDLKRWTARQLRGTSGRQQDALMAGGLALGAYGLYSTGSTAWKIAQGLLARAGPQAGGSLAADLAANAAGGALGSRMAARTATRATATAETAVLEREAAAAAGGAAASGGLRAGLGRFAARIPAIAFGAKWIDTAMDSGGDWYDAHRRAGHSKIGSGIGTALDTGTEAVYGSYDWIRRQFGDETEQAKKYRHRRMSGAGYSEEELNRMDARIASGEGHRNVTPADAGFEEVGRGYERIQEKASLEEPIHPTPASPAVPLDAGKPSDKFEDAVNKFGRFVTMWAISPAAAIREAVRPGG
jgi:hypothetical protein